MQIKAMGRISRVVFKTQWCQIFRAPVLNTLKGNMKNVMKRKETHQMETIMQHKTLTTMKTKYKIQMDAILKSTNESQIDTRNVHISPTSNPPHHLHKPHNNGKQI